MSETFKPGDLVRWGNELTPTQWGTIVAISHDGKTAFVRWGNTPMTKRDMFVRVAVINMHYMEAQHER